MDTLRKIYNKLITDEFDTNDVLWNELIPNDRLYCKKDIIITSTAKGETNVRDYKRKL